MNIAVLLRSLTLGEAARRKGVTEKARTLKDKKVLFKIYSL